MGNTSRNIIGKNIKSARNLLGLSQLNFSMLTSLSKTTIVNIESAKTGYNLDLLENIINFLDCTLSEISSKDFEPNEKLKEVLTIKYKFSRPDYVEILNKAPKIVYAIKFKLLKGDFIDSPKETNEIKEYFEKFGWKYRGSSISNALQRMPKNISVRNHEKKANTKLYQKK
jgi:transcriptional regulator with XRE-family HTH domain